MKSHSPRKARKARKNQNLLFGVQVMTRIPNDSQFKHR